ncbi:MAG: acyltransferase domain-containing protein, partial [Coriobacteriales bacterium]|nr:acyltransferase domain-containing protein [Coriobacteriales bacterium]
MKAKLWIVSPFETPDTGLVRASYAAGVFPVLHLGRDLAKAQEALQELALLPERSFGVAVTDGSMEGLRLPKQVATIVAPFGVRPPKAAGAQTVWQVHSVAEAGQALKKKAAALIIKGSEGAGLCGEESSFILFQYLSERCAKAGVALYVQGGVGVHTAAAYLALGAQGVILDSQVALMPECGTADGLRRTLEHLNGSEIKRCGEYRYYTRPGAPELDEDATRDDLFAAMDASDEDAYLPLGQDVILAVDYVQEYGRLRHLVRAIEQAAFSHLELARERNVLGPGNNMATMLGTTYPIAQGPMARISDVPEFLNSVAKGGGLPFLAMSMMVGPAAQKALTATSELLAGKPWGAGILGFTFPKIVEEQTKLILEAKPPVVLIAGGRPAQARVFEDAGIKVFLHVPAAGLLDMFLKEGARCFIFEGRESGGHVGPLYSTVLWEKQINRLLRADDKAALSVFFAGGIHDAHSAAFVSIMAAPLTARDVNVGVLAGTAYLYSNEIVSSGAITEEYRRLVIEKDYTVLLKSGAGQETRSVSSPFTDYFLSEKARLHKEGVQGQELLMKLEELNLGRLRVAAKGVERQGSELKELTAAEQVEGGLFMTGAVTSIIHTSTTIPAIHKDLSVKSRALISKLKPFPTKYDTGHAVDKAIVGMEGIFPDAENVDEYWRNILCGKNSMSEVDAERWEPTLFYDPDVPDTDHVPSKWGGFLGAIDFDAFEFGITPNSLASIEPVQLLSLLVAKRALADAGYTDLAKVDLDDTSVIFGAQGTGELSAAFGTRAGFTQFFGELPAQIAGILPVLTEDSFPGVLSNVIAGRISNRLNTGGRNFVVDAACASSLAALEIAVGQLASGSSNMVVLGGADLHNGITDFLMFASTYALSHKGRCSTFDADADGIALGEGVGVVILKRLEDAVNDGNKIYAVVKGTGGSSDGRSLGLTAPSKRGQVKALQRAYHNAGISPTQVGLVEAHGTGTVVGDRIELSALTDVFLDAGAKPAQAHLGSVKTQIGHTKCAAGVASLIKTALCVQHGLLPPTLNLVNPNDAYSKSSPFAFKTQKAGLWHQDQRIAAVSGFGFGGANFHAVLQNYEASTPAIPLAVWPSELFVFRGDTPQEAQELMDKVGRLHGANNKLKLKDIAYSLSRYSQKPVQYALTAGSWPELLQHLGATLDNQDDKLVHVLRPLEGKVAFLFPGQGSQRVNMAADLFVVFKQMRTLLDAHPEYEGLIFPNAVFTDDARKTQRAELTDTRNAQPALGIVDLAIAELLRNLGIEADVVAGHSYGELPALCFAGALDQDALVGLSHNRALSILDAVGDDAGGMAAVHTSKEALDQLLADEDEVWAVNLNAPTQTVVAASTAGMEGFLKRLEEAKVAFDVLSVACAFHSPLLAGAQERFAQVLEAVTVKKPTLPVWSNTTAKAYPRTPAAIKARLAEHLVKPVRFVEEIEHMYEDGVRVFVETGPGAVLTGLAGKTLKGKDFAVIQTERGNTDGISYLLNGIAKYISTGREIKMENLFEGRDVELIDLDDAARYEKKSTVWSVSGYDAQPVVGERPAHAGKPLASLPASERQWGAYQSNNSVEAIMAAYLDNMNSLIQDQRDVMLGYLGQPELIPRATSAPRQFAYTQANAAVLPAAIVREEPIVVAEASAPGNDTLPEISSLSREQITTIVIDVVSEKTGYPIDMLTLEADLEADLSIDSIKK